ncbi:hypothetical protein M422DRAFT_248336 [Sphaerobolus stellatus SS14]|uniref:Uncharacterized protein n=1 Tax=Sphaerobolus stellatus (strain SS14) TaxID=990650 RepID=A0A0C9VVQ2_SPHS4|nr:hypothetical protein M422DRAFT_248336 [Sphaerobolus stellatus SS14]
MPPKMKAKTLPDRGLGIDSEDPVPLYKSRRLSLVNAADRILKNIPTPLKGFQVLINQALENNLDLDIEIKLVALEQLERLERIRRKEMEHQELKKKLEEAQQKRQRIRPV